MITEQDLTSLIARTFLSPLDQYTPFYLTFFTNELPSKSFTRNIHSSSFSCIFSNLCLLAARAQSSPADTHKPERPREEQKEPPPPELLSAADIYSPASAQPSLSGSWLEFDSDALCCKAVGKPPLLLHY